MTRRDLLEGAQLVGCIAAAIAVCALVLLGIPWLVVSFLTWNLNPAEWGAGYRAVAVVWLFLILVIAAGNS